MKPLHELTENEAFKRLQVVAVKISLGKQLGEDERRWIAMGLLALCRGEAFNDAFAVKNIKTPNTKTHVLRYLKVKKLRQQGKKKAEAFEEVAQSQNTSADTIETSWKKQQKIQNKFKKLIGK